MVSQCDVSKDEFHRVFECVDECVLAVFDEGVARLSAIVIDAAACEDDSFARIRAVLSALLGFLDDEPHWARLLIVERSAETVAVVERRQRALGALVRALAQEIRRKTVRAESFRPSAQLTAELIVGGVVSVIRARMLGAQPAPLVQLAPLLVSFILADQSPDGSVELRLAGSGQEDAVPGRERLPVRVTYRTTRVLSAIGASPRLSNREIADAAGLTDEGQTSKLLRRLEQRGLVENVGLGQAYGGANAWLLTGYGQRVLDATRHSLLPGAGAVTSKRIRGAA